MQKSSCENELISGKSIRFDAVPMQKYPTSIVLRADRFDDDSIITYRLSIAVGTRQHGSMEKQTPTPKF